MKKVYNNDLAERQKQMQRERCKAYYHSHKEMREEGIIIWKLKLKIEVLAHYGNGECACTICGESRTACLSIDHIYGSGHQHRKELGGENLYHWLKRNNYPEGYRTLCMNCQFVERDGKYGLKHKFLRGSYFYPS